MSFANFRAATGYHGVDSAYVTKSDSASSYNVRGKRYISVNGAAGTVTFRLSTGGNTAAIYIPLGASFELGSDMENIMSTGTTATDIATFY